jgi:hypothetical protein
VKSLWWEVVVTESIYFLFTLHWHTCTAGPSPLVPPWLLVTEANVATMYTKVARELAIAYDFDPLVDLFPYLTTKSEVKSIILNKFRIKSIHSIISKSSLSSRKLMHKPYTILSYFSFSSSGSSSSRNV